MGRAGLLFSIGIRCFFGFGILVSCSTSNSKGCCTCLILPCCLLSHSPSISRPITPVLVRTLHNSLKLCLCLQHLSRVNCVLLCYSRLSLLYTVADARPHYTCENCSCAIPWYLLYKHRTLTNQPCGAMQLLWILGPIALLIATMATLLCFFWMDFLPTPSRAQLHLLKSSDEHE